MAATPSTPPLPSTPSTTSAPDGSVHAVGNGHLLVYACGADITHLFGPDYSSASLAQITWRSDNGQLVHLSSARQPGAAVWSHEIGVGRDVHARIRATVDPDVNAWATTVTVATPILMVIRPSRAGRWIPPEVGTPRRTLFAADAGAPVFIYPDPAAPVLCITDASGRSEARHEDRDLIFGLEPGHHALVISVAASLEQIDRVASEAESLAGVVFERRAGHDRPTASALAERTSRWQAAGSWGGRAAGVVEGAVFSLLAQQSQDGGFMAGYAYPLAYGRDQYGTCRGLQSLGLTDAAVANQSFRHRKLRLFGNLANAESMGHDTIRHRHENDAVELTSYHVIQAVELASAEPARLDIATVLEDLVDCLRIQVEHVKGGMLPFNGDETYVAGGLLPRSVLEDGSLESTLLFVEAVRRLDRAAGLPRSGPLVEIRGIADQVEREWRANFGWDRGLGGWATNAPRRALIGRPRKARRGVCESCGLINPEFNRRSPTGRYLCSACSESSASQVPSVPARKYSLLSATLLPFLINPELLTGGERAAAFRDALVMFDFDGQLRTTPSSSRTVGYDAALLVLAAGNTHPELIPVCVDYLLAQLDDADMAGEYSEGGKPVGTRCRPWETGVSLHALATAARRSR